MQTEASVGVARVDYSGIRPGIWPWVIAAAALFALTGSISNDIKRLQTSLATASSAILAKHTSPFVAASGPGSMPGNIQVQVNGRDIHLTGDFPSAANREQMVAELRAVAGVRVVLDDMRELDAREQAKFDRLEFKQALGQLDSSGITFEPGSSSLSASGLPALQNLALLLRNQPERQIKIAGHTDNSGNPQSNLDISRQRAQAVADSLLANGVRNEQLIVQGYGHTRPLYSNDTEAGRSRNRRIEFIFMK